MRWLATQLSSAVYSSYLVCRQRDCVGWSPAAMLPTQDQVTLRAAKIGLETNTSRKAFPTPNNLSAARESKMSKCSNTYSSFLLKTWQASEKITTRIDEASIEFSQFPRVPSAHSETSLEVKVRVFCTVVRLVFTYEWETWTLRVGDIRLDVFNNWSLQWILQKN